MSMSIFQLLMLLFVWKHFWQPSPPTVFFKYTQSMHLLGHPAYMKMWIILMKMIFIFWNYCKLCWAL